MTQDQDAADAADVGGVVMAAFAYVCELDAASLRPETRLDDIDADSLVLVAVADLVEDRLGAAAAGWRIDDADLARAATIGELVAAVHRTAGGTGSGGRPVRR